MINSIVEKQLIDMGSVTAKEAKKAFDSKAVEDVIKQAAVSIADFTEDMCHFTSVTVTETPICSNYTSKTEVSSKGEVSSWVIEKAAEISSISPYVFIPLDVVNNLGRVQINSEQRDKSLSVIADNILSNYKTMIRKSVIDILRENSTKIDVVPSLNAFFPESISKIAKQLCYSGSYDVEQNILFVVTPKVYYLLKNFLKENNVYFDMESILVDCWSEKDYCVVAGQSEVLSYGNINKIINSPVKTFIHRPITVTRVTDPNTGKPTLAIGADIAFIKDENISEIAYRLEF